MLACHAEESVIAKYNSSIGVGNRKSITSRKLHLYVIRIDSFSNLTESKPCSHCVQVMVSYGIRKITYSTKSGILVTESLSTIISHDSIGYRSVANAISIIDEMLDACNQSLGIT